MDSTHPERPPQTGSLRPGEVIDERYRIEQLLSQGGMGAVFVAHDLERGVRVALKTILPDLLEENDLARFEREAQLAARVDHNDGVVRVHRFGRHGPIPYCVMELVEGESLAELLRGGPVDPERLLPIVEHLARTLARCHDEGVLHRDLKPANIVVRPDGRPTVLDFGLARDLAADRMTRTGELLGTPAYMAPEQALDSARAVDARVDVYGLGAVLYHGLTGRPPFQGNPLAILSSLGRREPPTPGSLLPGLSADVDAVCRQAMAIDPEDRYASMHELAADLARLAAGEPVVARPLSPAARWRRRLRRAELAGVLSITLAALVVLLLALGGGYLGVIRPQRRAHAAQEAWRSLEAEQLRRWYSGRPLDVAAIEGWRLRHEAADAPTRERSDLFLALSDPARPSRDAAVLAFRRADPRAGLATLADAAGPGAAAVRFELRRRLMRADATPAEARELLKSLAGESLPPDQLRPLIDAAVERLWRAVIRRALRNKPLEASSIEALTAPLLRSRSELLAVLARGRTAAIAAERPAIADALHAPVRAGNPERARDPVVQLHRLLELRPATRVGPTLAGTIERSLARSAALWRAAREPQAQERIAGAVATQLLTLDAKLGWSRPTPELREVISCLTLALITQRSERRRSGEASLVCLAFGWSHSPEAFDLDACVSRFRKLCDPAQLLSSYPDNLGAKLLELNKRESVGEDDDTLKRPKFLDDMTSLARGGPGLSPAYRAYVQLELADKLDDHNKDAPAPARRAQRARSRRLALAARAAAIASPYAVLVRRSFQLEFENNSRQKTPAVMAAGLAALRARVLRAESDARCDAARRRSERTQLVLLLLYVSRYMDDQDGDSARTWALDAAYEAFAIVQRGVDEERIRWDAHANLAQRLLSLRRYEEACGAVESGLPIAGLSSGSYVHAALKALARRRRGDDLDRARALVQRGIKNHPRDKRLKEIRARIRKLLGERGS